MFGNIARFEFNYQLKSPAFVIIFLIFFMLTYFTVAASQFVSIGGGGNVNVNGPFSIVLTTIVMSIFAIFLPTALLSNTVLRDDVNKMDGIVFSTPVTKGDYLLGRFSGAFAAVIIAFSSIPLGILVGSFMPWVDPETLGPLRPLDYLYAIFIIGVPNMLITGMIMFVVANLTRSNAATYVALIVFLFVYVTTQVLAANPELRDIVALFDPFGGAAFGEATRNWTAFERNEKLPPLEGLFLYNRLLWLGLGLAFLALNYVLFSFRKNGKKQKKAKTQTDLPKQRFVPTEITLPAVTRVFNSATSRAQFFARVGFEIRTVFASVTFWVLLTLGTLNTIAGLSFNEVPVFGTPTMPLTRIIINVIAGSFGIIPMVVAIFYAADLMWRDRSVKMHEIIDSTPTPNWAFMFPKFVAISLVLIALLAFSIVVGMIFQMLNGYMNFEPGQYFIRVIYLMGTGFIMVAALAIFLQVVFNHRYLGMLAMVVFLIGTLVFDAFGFEHNLYQFSGTPGVAYSDINGYGHFLAIANWFKAYWGFFTVALLIVTYLLWNRGTLTPLLRRIRDIPNVSTRGSTVALATSLLATAGLGGYIFYNTNILNDYVTGRDRERIAVDYEKTYRQYQNDAQPKITDVNVSVDIYPYQRRYDVSGSYDIENKTGKTLSKVHVEYNSAAEVISQGLTGATIGEADEKHKVYVYNLETPMQPGEKRTLTFNTRVSSKGFRNSGNGVTVVYNGTFINNSGAMPAFGFQPQRMLQDRNTRRRYDLEEIERMPKLEDESQYRTGALRGDADFVNFEAIVSTVPDQIGMAPGYLEREWTENGRRYFHYKMDVPIQNFFSFQSARYEVKKDQWEDVVIEIYYHKRHTFNVDRMIEATKVSLEYFSKNFSPFQYRQLRILEFPYRSFAQSFPNTVPFSENIGFVADTSDPDTVDSVFYVTAHEVAHQWWGHQVTAANVQGATMLIETFAQYSAFMAVEKEFGVEHVRDFLKLELDNYLAARGSERLGELPLYRVENQQYIHYQKGSLVMYALKDYVGEDVVNRALARLIDLRQYSSDPYPITLDFLKILREEAGPKHNDLITDLFEKITLFDLEAKTVEVEERDDGRFDVTLTYEARKFYANDVGEETEAEIAIPIDIGVFVKSPADSDFERDDVLYLKKHKIDPANPVITITVDQKPEFAGIDPYVKLIDRDADNNVQRAS